MPTTTWKVVTKPWTSKAGYTYNFQSFEASPIDNLDTFHSRLLPNAFVARDGKLEPKACACVACIAPHCALLCNASPHHMHAILVITL